MKYLITFILIFLSASFMQVNAQLLLNETFDYNETDLKKVSSWKLEKNEDNDYNDLKNTSFRLTDNTLSYSNQGSAYLDSDTGKKLDIDFYTSTWATLQMVKTFKKQTKGTIYMAFMIHLNEMPLYNNNVKHQAFFSTIGMSESGSSRGPLLWIKKIEGKNAYSFGATNGSRKTDEIVMSDKEFDDTEQTHLVVLKYDIASKKGALYLNPVPGSEEPTPDIIINEGSANIRSVSSIYLYHAFPKSNQSYSIAGIRVSPDWKEATAAKK